METAIFAFSRRGCELAEKIRNCLLSQDSVRLYTVKRLTREGFRALEDAGTEVYASEFLNSTLMIFVSAAGIAVRKIAPYVKDKKTDPAVICIDEKGSFVIPLLSGHIGGANQMAGKLAQFLGAVAVVTTTTDVNGKFAVDEWAAENGFVISDMKMAKYISASILENDIPICCDFPVKGGFPPGTFPLEPSRSEDPAVTQQYDTGIYIGYRNIEPFTNTLRIIPKVVRLGTGCRKGIGKENISQAVEKILETENVDERAINGVYSIDLKANEPGLIEYCKEKGWKLTTCSAEELKKVNGAFTASSFVESVAGVDNVCERAAAMEGTLIAGKTSMNGVTCALACEDISISFDSAM